MIAALAGGMAAHTYHQVRPLFVSEAPAPSAPRLPVDPTTPPVEAGASELDELHRRRLLVPVAGIDPHGFTDTFTQGRNGRAHEAIDIMAPRGTPVIAVDDGRIEKLFTSERGGLTIYQFDLAGTYSYYYAHLDRYAPGLHEGQLVHRGERLGDVGSTGNAAAEAPHLHFTIFKLLPERRWWEGVPVNPFPLWRSGEDLG